MSATRLSRPSPSAFAVAFAAAWLAAAAALAQPAWDVTDTGQPFTDIAFTVNEGSWMSLDVSPDGKTIVFDLLNDIYALPASGGEAQLVHGGPAAQHSPSFSPDGARIVYLSDASGADNVWTSRPDGSDPRQATQETHDILAGPAWGPRGEGVVAALTRSSFPGLNASEIRLFDPAGGAGRVIVEAPKNGRDVQEASLSPDGRYVYYSERLTDAAVYFDANHVNFAVRRRDLATGNVQDLASGFGGATSPAVSPDGTRVAFVRRVKAKTVLFLLDVAAGEQRPLWDGLDRDLQADFTPQAAYYPRYDWFPDGRHIAIWAKGKIWKLDVESGAASEIPFHLTARHRITTPVRVKTNLAPATVQARTLRHLAPSPDGAALVFTALGRLWRTDRAGAAPRRLTKAVADEFEPVFSRDGKRLAWVEWDDQAGSALKLASSDGHDARTIASSRGVIRQPAFSADGATLVYRIQAGDKAMGGFRARPGIYSVSAKGGDARFVVAGDDAPMLSPDGKRIFYVALDYAGGSAVYKLISVTRDGIDPREHARTPDADTSELRVSPDLNWIGFKDRQQYYVAPLYPAASPQLVAAGDDAVPVSRLTASGGNGLTWSADASRLYWTLGAELFSAAPGALARSVAKIDLSVPGDVPTGDIAFTNARILTMAGDAVIEQGTVLVSGAHIRAVGPSAEVAIPAGAKRIDLGGKTVMPGLIDMHGHVDCCYGKGAMPQQQPARFAELAFGVTTVFDPYSTDQPSYESSERTAAGLMTGPRWIGSGQVTYGRSDKADFIYTPIETYADAQAVMARKVAMGGVVIKSYKQPTRRQRQMLVKAGREAGVMVDVEGESHFHNDISMVTDGHTNLEHNLPLANYYDDVVQFMAKAGAHNTPVLNVSFGELFGENYMYQRTRAWDDPKVRTYVNAVISGYSPLNALGAAPPYVRGMTAIQAADEIWDVGVLAVSRATRKLDDAGVTINVGSHGDFPGLGMHWEMQMLAAGGMSNARILRAATLNGARTLGFDHQLGSIEPGKLADLIVLDRDPLADIRNTESVRYTMVNGRLYDAFSLDEIGNRERPRSKFYWELQDTGGVDWNETWSGQ